MAYDWEAKAQLVLTMLEKYGAEAVLNRRGKQTIGPGGSAVSSGPGPVTINVVQVAAGTRDGMANAAGAQLQEGIVARTMMFAIAVVDPEPATGDTITFAGKTLTINDVRTVAPAGVPVVHFASVTAP